MKHPARPAVRLPPRLPSLAVAVLLVAGALGVAWLLPLPQASEHAGPSAHLAARTPSRKAAPTLPAERSTPLRGRRTAA